MHLNSITFATMLRIGILDFLFMVGFPALTAILLAHRHRHSISNFWQRGIRSAAWCSAFLAVVSLIYTTISDVTSVSTQPINFDRYLIVPVVIFVVTFLTGSLPAVFVTWRVGRGQFASARAKASPANNPDMACQNPYRSPRS